MQIHSTNKHEYDAGFDIQQNNGMHDKWQATVNTYQCKVPPYWMDLSDRVDFGGQLEPYSVL